MYKFVGLLVSSVALILLGVSAAVVEGGSATAQSTNSIGGAGVTVTQETGGVSIPETTVVISASPQVKAKPCCA